MSGGYPEGEARLVVKGCRLESVWLDNEGCLSLRRFSDIRKVEYRIV